MIQIKELQTYNIRMQYELSEDSHFCAISCFLKILRTSNFRVSLKENENFFSFFFEKFMYFAGQNNPIEKIMKTIFLYPVNNMFTDVIRKHLGLDLEDTGGIPIFL